MTEQETIALINNVLSLDPKTRQDRNIALLARQPLIDLELVSACNVTCTFCPRSEMLRENHKMDEKTFSAVENFLPPDAIIMFSGLGDSLLHPKLVTWVKRLTSRGHSTCLITNGVLLTPERQQSLISAGIAQFQISLHGLDEQTVSRIVHVGACPSRVHSNLEYLAQNKPEHLRVRINFVETKTNHHARLEVENFATQQGFEFFYRREHTRGGSLSGGRIPHSHGDCGIFASVTFITCDGIVLPCVNDVSGIGAYGSVHELSWSDVLAWKKHTVKTGRWFSVCNNCDDDYRWVIIGQDGLTGC